MSMGPESPFTDLSCDLVGPPRCYAFWQELLGCYVVNSAEGDSGKRKCIPALEDYYECLHHQKEVGGGSRGLLLDPSC
jgi:hypothetical protein